MDKEQIYNRIDSDDEMTDTEKREEYFAAREEEEYEDEEWPDR